VKKLSKEHQENTVGIFREICEEDGMLSYSFWNITDEEYNTIISEKPVSSGCFPEAAFQVSSFPFTGAEHVEWQITDGQIIYVDGVVINDVTASQVILDVVSDMIVEDAIKRKVDVLRIKIEKQSLVSTSLQECSVEIIKSDADYVYFEVDIAETTGNKEFSKFDEQYHQWYDRFEKEDGLKEGVQVRYIGVNDNNTCLKYPQYCGFPSDPRGILELDAVYEVEYRLLSRSWQKVKLVGFCDFEFSPSIFEVIDKNAESKPLKEGGRVCYIGREDDFLTSGNIYEVEGLLIHYHGSGFVSVKLVGIEKIYDRRLFERAL